jgi:hypothetical protein
MRHYATAKRKMDQLREISTFKKLEQKLQGLNLEAMRLEPNFSIVSLRLNVSWQALIAKISQTVLFRVANAQTANAIISVLFSILQYKMFLFRSHTVPIPSIIATQSARHF